jgi:hypothetical protein
VVRSALGVILIAVGLLGTAVGCTQGCPVALLEGVLVDQDAGLVVVRDDGVVEAVNWAASQDRVHDEAGVLFVVNELGAVKAREGDFVRLGGGERDGRWNVCGMFEVGRVPAS